ncbi:MAG: hypothetical protein AVDCRST_MAG85-3862 [uncultured Solirubrobacteraceae bacterium]|uniref:HD domain-containing protein n=1 Tax=uncultured Solirubrobacteraceae bacterium TaxID=1162706 RepID=A0A6J4TXV2_9ACTN|nr:MAG: hypothetical protein AVDCRST_MAG85-3862 [uncultured Solirubrobacteraceae bacterium]
MSGWRGPVDLPPAPAPGAAAPRLSAWADRLLVLAAMAACPQDPLHHGEGDVLVHTQMVCDELVAGAEWRSLPVEGREELWLAAVLHDCGKPQTTREEDGRLRAPGHARAGAILARRLLWQAGVPWAARERVCGLVRWHMTPYHLLDRPDSARQAILMSLSVNPARLRLLVECDARGRLAPDVEALAETVALAWEVCAELGCGDGPFPFANDHARFTYFVGRADRDPTWAAHDDTSGRLTLLSGLPGAGKDHWVTTHAGDAVVVSLDDLRRERGAKRTDQTAQGQIVQEARERLRVELRAWRDVVWNTTGLSRQLRAPLVSLGHDYGVRVRIVCVEAEPATLAEQNARRSDPVPEGAIERLLGRWEFPGLDECHERVVAERLRFPAR